MKYPIKLFLTLLFVSQTVIGQNLSDLKVEPPFWYANMPTEKLQISLYGESISTWNVAIDHPGITFVNQINGDSPNYLFLNLEISPDVTPGTFNIVLSLKKQRSSLTYELKERPSPENRNQGFSSEDVIYLLMPDRFANGN